MDKAMDGAQLGVIDSTQDGSMALGTMDDALLGAIGDA